MKPEDHKGLPSFRRLYLELNDPEGYRVATEVLGGWEHWQTLMGSKWFQEYIQPIKEELEVKLRSDAIMVMYEIMLAKDKSALPAAKFFTEAGFKPKRGRGRPSNEEVEAETRRQAAIRKRLREDAKRLGISVAVDNE